MTVKDFIVKLQKLDQTLPVIAFNGEYEAEVEDAEVVEVAEMNGEFYEPIGDETIKKAVRIL